MPWILFWAACHAPSPDRPAPPAVDDPSSPAETGSSPLPTDDAPTGDTGRGDTGRGDTGRTDTSAPPVTLSPPNPREAGCAPPQPPPGADLAGCVSATQEHLDLVLPGKTTTRTYDDRGRLVRQEYAYLHDDTGLTDTGGGRVEVQTWTYDPATGLLARHVFDANEGTVRIVTTYEYVLDSEGRPVEERRWVETTEYGVSFPADEPILTLNTWGPCGVERVEVVGAWLIGTWYWTDGKTVLQADARGTWQTVNEEHTDPEGWLIRSERTSYIDPSAPTTSVTHYRWDRGWAQLLERETDGDSTRYTYDEAGREVEKINAASRWVTTWTCPP